MKRWNQNQKISFPFFAGSPHTPAEKGIVRKFLVLGSRPKGACEAQRSFVKILRILLEIVSNFVQQTPPKLEIGIKSRDGSPRSADPDSSSKCDLYIWRKRRDSNSRDPFRPAAFPRRCTRPLCDAS